MKILRSGCGTERCCVPDRSHWLDRTPTFEVLSTAASDDEVDLRASQPGEQGRFQFAIRIVFRRRAHLALSELTGSSGKSDRQTYLASSDALARLVLLSMRSGRVLSPGG